MSSDKDQHSVLSKFCVINPLTPMSDQERISPHNINTISSRQVMRIKKNVIKGLFFDPMTNSPN